jgi:hypothetical protein
MYMHPKGTSCRAPRVKFIELLDLEQNISFMDRHELADRTSSIISEAVSWMLLMRLFHFQAG